MNERYHHRHYRFQVSGYKCTTNTNTNTNTNINTNINKRAKGEYAECISWVLCFLCQRLPQSLHLLDIIVIMAYTHQGRYSLKLVLFSLLYILNFATKFESIFESIH